jgi:Fic family protein
MSSTGHSWITFEFDTRRIQPSTWLLLGEALSKCEHLIGSPLKPTIAQELAAIYLTKGVKATTAIEGNTLSEEQVRARIEGDGKLAESLEYQGQEVDNIARALASIDESMETGLPKLCVDEVLRLHGIVLAGMADPPDKDPGKFRSPGHNVGVGTYGAPPGTDVQELMERMCEWLGGLEPQPDAPRHERFTAAILSAVLAHLYLAWIHPFGDGNGRTARLVEVLILARSGLVPMVATNLLSDHYNRTRPRYYEQLAKASKIGHPYDFVHYAVAGFVDELREQIKVVKGHNLRVAWESFVHEAFAKVRGTDAKRRQRSLALALPPDRWITKAEATELTHELIREFAVAGPRMPARDLNTLVSMGLAHRRGDRYLSAMDRLQAWVSPVAEPMDIAKEELDMIEDLPGLRDLPDDPLPFEEALFSR